MELLILYWLHRHATVHEIPSVVLFLKNIEGREYLRRGEKERKGVGFRERGLPVHEPSVARTDEPHLAVCSQQTHS